MYVVNIYNIVNTHVYYKIHVYIYTYDIYCTCIYTVQHTLCTEVVGLQEGQVPQRPDGEGACIVM